METTEQIQSGLRINSTKSQSCRFFDHKIGKKLPGRRSEEWEENKKYTLFDE